MSPGQYEICLSQPGTRPYFRPTFDLENELRCYDFILKLVRNLSIVVFLFFLNIFYCYLSIFIRFLNLGDSAHVPMAGSICEVVACK